MPDTPNPAPTPPPPTPVPPSSPTLPSGTPTSASTPELGSMVAPEYRYPDNETVPQYLRGKTASDAAQLLQAMVDSAARGGAAPSAIPTPPPPAQEDEYVTGAHLRHAQQEALAQVNPYLQTVADQQATFGYNLVKTE